MATRRIAIVLAAVGLFVPAAMGQELLVNTWGVDRDSFTYPGNHGSRSAGRWGKGRSNDACLYVDWSDADLADLTTQMAGAVPVGYDRWEVRMYTTGADWDTPDPSLTYQFGTILLDQDWDEATSTWIEAATGVAWQQGGSNYGNFWLVPDHLINAVPFQGFAASRGLGDVDTNEAVVDSAIVTALTGNPDVRGIRFWSNDSPNS